MIRLSVGVTRAISNRAGGASTKFELPYCKRNCYRQRQTQIPNFTTPKNEKALRLVSLKLITFSINPTQENVRIWKIVQDVAD